MTVPQFTPLPPAPSRSDDGASFRSKADAFVAAQQQFADDGNAIAEFVNQKVTDLDEHSSAAVNAAKVLNYQGEWDSGTNYSVGQSVTYAGEFWVANAANSNSTPTLVNANWQVVDSLDTADYNHLSQNKPQSYWLEHLLAKVGTSVLPTPSLDLDFEKGIYKVEGESDSFGNVVTYTRSSLASAYKASTRLDTAVAVDTPQFEYDPETGEQYLLLESSRTNEALRSEEFDSVSWAKTLVAISPDAVAAPDGLVTADLMTEQAGLNVHRVSQTRPVSGQVCAGVSVANAVGTRWVMLLVEGASGSAFAHVNPATGEIGVFSTSGSYSHISDPTVITQANGFYRISVSVDVAGDTSVSVRVNLKQGNNTVSVYDGDGTSGIYIWGAQLEEGSYPTSYIKTTTTSVTRAAPSTTVPVGEWFNPNEGTFVVEVASLPSAGILGILGVYNTVSGFGASRTLGSFVYSPAVGRVYYSTDGAYNEGVPLGSNGLLAISGSADGHVICSGGVSVSGVAGLNSIQPDVLQLGRWDSGATDFFLGGGFKRLTYYPKALNEAQLKALTSA